MLRSSLFLLFTVFTALASPTLAQSAGLTQAAKPGLVVGFAFDWDDNVFEMPTQIMLFDKKTGRERGVSTEDFALIRGSIGKAGTAWEAYEIRPSTVDGSLRFFGDDAKEGKDLFARDIDKAMSTPGYRWQGPVWRDFVAAMRQQQTADQTWIITARLHSPATIHQALQKLQKQGLIKTVLPEDHIWAVSYAGFDEGFKQAFGRTPPTGGASDPSARKAAVMENILDGINAKPLPANGPKTLDAAGSALALQHLWGFSDDDFGNFSKARDVLQKGVDALRWPHVKITIFFTGTNHPTEKPRAVVLRPKAAPRPFTETAEWQQILGGSDGTLLYLNKKK